MGITCKQCGYENPEGSTICEICGESLVEIVESAPVVQPVQSFNEPAQPQNVVNNMQATTAQVGEMVNDGNEYYVLCPESQTKTILPNGRVKRYYCEGCKKEHDIDGILWMIEKREPAQSVTNSAPEVEAKSAKAGDNLWLEEVNSHFRIDIDKDGGMLGRYGKYGADFFQSRGLLMVSGEHCLITNEFGNWVIRHVSKTNQTMYNNMILGTNEPNLLEDGKTLTLANAVSFNVRIG